MHILLSIFSMTYLLTPMSNFAALVNLELDPTIYSWTKMAQGDGSALRINLGTIMAENPYGEKPSRTLFVLNINSDVEESELHE
jgi:hypothetical protein